jgi:hypothetical protein
MLDRQALDHLRHASTLAFLNDALTITKETERTRHLCIAPEMKDITTCLPG